MNINPNIEHWDRVSGIELAKRVEDAVQTFGAHVALGGSVLTKGISIKDLDLFIYPHQTAYPYDLEILKKSLSSIGFCGFNEVDHKEYGDDKRVLVSYWDGKRVDLFFL